MKDSMAEKAVWDLVVVGGGITGAGIILDAQKRGLKCLLLEKADFSSGSSSKSTKLIHGGLRYLQTFEFALVSQVGKERRVAHQMAPHLVVPEEMVIPLYKGGKWNKVMLHLALAVYDFLAGVQKKDRYQYWSGKELISNIPEINPRLLNGGFKYSEYRTDDGRLTFELLKDACSIGAEARNYHEVRGILGDKKKGFEVQVCDRLQNITYRVQAKMVVNAAGPWSDKIRSMHDADHQPIIHFSKGIHIVVSKKRLPITLAMYCEAIDGRMFFIIPREDKVYIGTTDSEMPKAELDNLGIALSEVIYLLDSVNKNFKMAALTLSDVEASWVGVRPLIHQEGKNSKEISRKDELFVSQSGMLHIAGGKLTGFRLMAKKVVDRVVGLLELHPSDYKCNTKMHKLAAGMHPSERIEMGEAIIRELKQMGLVDVKTWAHRLIHLYGKRGLTIATMASNFSKERKEQEIMLVLIKSELQYCIEHEKIKTLEDFVVRRSALIYFNSDLLSQYKQQIQSYYNDLTSERNDQMQIQTSLEDLLVQVKNFSS